MYFEIVMVRSPAVGEDLVLRSERFRFLPTVMRQLLFAIEQQDPLCWSF